MNLIIIIITMIVTIALPFLFSFLVLKKESFYLKMIMGCLLFYLILVVFIVLDINSNMNGVWYNSILTNILTAYLLCFYWVFPITLVVLISKFIESKTK